MAFITWIAPLTGASGIAGILFGEKKPAERTILVQIEQLAARTPAVSVDELLNGFYPSPRFGKVSFASYRPDPKQPSQAGAVTALESFAAGVGNGDGAGLFKRLFAKKDNSRAGIYLDGGFGVGKTHLLASLWHAAPGPKAFGTFVEYTNLVGALSFRKTVEALSNYKLVCIDEFELDDPGDTVLMSRLMRELADAGVKLAATSNTLPGSLGDGRFAAVDFQREIQVLADQFDVVRIDGEDFRHRGLPAAPAPLRNADLTHHMQAEFDGKTVARMISRPLSPTSKASTRAATGSSWMASRQSSGATSKRSTNRPWPCASWCWPTACTTRMFPSWRAGCRSTSSSRKR
ncbi:uncharacterized protein YhcM [Arthrobacter sp. Hiyo6]|nr:uncharacterized protein YhcM [Arthrobacter sp. Hiyo6]